MKPSTEAIEATSKMRPLPVVNFLDIDDKIYADAIVDEALPQDRARFRGYLSHRPLGLGLIAAGPGFGKTTAGAAATLAMEAKLGKILCSGPTHVALNNLASRLDQRSRATADRCNQGKELDDPTRRRRKLVVRAFKLAHEHTALERVLSDIKTVDTASIAKKSGTWRRPSRWQLQLSVAFWLLVVLRCPTVRDLDRDDNKALHQLRYNIDGREDLADLRAVATGVMDFEEFKTAHANMADVTNGLFEAILDAADMLCTTPAATENDKELRHWKTTLARGVAVDEAANMNRADLYCVWGNTLLPCFLFGDPKQLPPTVMTFKDKDATGNFVNRFANDGKVSPLVFFQATGIPVYRLKTQLRMANGMFDMVSKIVYPSVPLEYAQSCEISLPQFQVGRDLEAFVQERYPAVTAPPAGTLKPVFLHCEGSRVFVDDMTGSKRSPDQVKIALDFAVDFVKTKKVDAGRIVVIAPYAANVDLIDRMRKKPEYAVLSTMQPATTVDSFQGQENDIALVIMGTAYPKPGPGFTSDEQRLNVMLTRQLCGLVIVGDINVTGVLEEKGGKGKGKGKGKPQGKGKDGSFKIVGPTGEIYWTKASTLRHVYNEMHSSGRVAIVKVEREAKGAPRPSTS
ncbi:hypothetical protein AK830_g8828 [Neonectria ditissima]|uniref:DNA2/NAM7 helicase-like C-terminal domain-containing protein n=1 Tax=Neonectria ditissima TaxID=78410 RepID=A0A0P7AWE2_9HYPO|nr:hypothetical protein AK830_g8828 [Neonectria ditissima]